MSKYPISINDFQEIVEGTKGDAGNGKYIKKTTWMEAITFCNLFSLHRGLPPSYDADTGLLIDETGTPAKELHQIKGFRLPTAMEWEYAAEGWSPQFKCGSYVEILRKHFRFYDVDPDRYMNGCAEIGDLQMNAVGLMMLGNVREWYSDNETRDGLKNKMCFWDEYIVNYNNDYSYMVRQRVCTGDVTVGFRVALSCGTPGEGFETAARGQCN